MFAIQARHFRRIVFASALYDLLVTLPLATPWTYGLLHGALSAGNVMLGAAPLPEFQPLHMMMVNMLGTVVIIWSLVRMRNPSIEFGRWDGLGRFAFTLWMARAFALQDAPILLFFMLPEISWGIAQWWPIKREDEAISGPTWATATTLGLAK